MYHVVGQEPGQVTTPTVTPTQPFDWGTITSGKIADTKIGSSIRAS
jgi:hypothetical protein